MSLIYFPLIIFPEAVFKLYYTNILWKKLSNMSLITLLIKNHNSCSIPGRKVALLNFKKKSTINIFYVPCWIIFSLLARWCLLASLNELCLKMSSDTVLLMWTGRKENNTDTGKYDKVVWTYIVWIYRGCKVFLCKPAVLWRVQVEECTSLEWCVYPRMWFR